VAEAKFNIKIRQKRELNNLTKLKELRHPKTQHRCLMAGIQRSAIDGERPTAGTGRAEGANALFLDTVLAPPFDGKRWKGKMNTAFTFCLPTGRQASWQKNI